MKIAYIKWNYGTSQRKMLHLIRLKNGQGILKTTEQMKRLGLL